MTGWYTQPTKMACSVLVCSPSPELAPFVHSYEERNDDFGDQTLVRPLAARPAQNIEFYLADRGSVHDLRRNENSMLPAALAGGPLTRRDYDLLLRGRLHKFAIQFRPAGFHSLFGVPLHELTNQALPLEDVLGRRTFAQILQRLGDVPSFLQRTTIAEAWLRGIARSLDDGRMTSVASLLSRVGRPIAIPRLAALSGLGKRQFERQFRSSIGIAPKLYGRMLRFDRAMALRLSAPEASWTTISQDVGYFDQSHMIRDFRAFSRDAPNDFLRQAEPAREELLKVVRDVANVQSDVFPFSI